MTEFNTKDQTCVIIGASHAGVNCAFALRKEGWKGAILLFDSDPMLPYHRPPLSKTSLTNYSETGFNYLKPIESYEANEIALNLGILVTSIHRKANYIKLSNGNCQTYDKLVIAIGAQAFIPPIPGIDKARNVFTLRTAQDVINIYQAINTSKSRKVIIIGAGYIGLETAASLKKLGAQVTVLEREKRALSRVTTPGMSSFFEQLHQKNNVEILTNKNVIAIERTGDLNKILCDDHSGYEAEIIIVGVGIRVNTKLAEEAGLQVKDGIQVDQTTCTNDANIYAIGDCTLHYNPHYERFIRLESVQNAVDQAKITAAALSGKDPVYKAIPWFWSDQYNVKLQIAGLSEGFNQTIMRKESDKDDSFSIWYFKDDRLLAVDAVNHAKAYVVGTKLIKEAKEIDKNKLADQTVALKPANLLVD